MWGANPHHITKTHMRRKVVIRLVRGQGDVSSILIACIGSHEAVCDIAEITDDVIKLICGHATHTEDVQTRRPGQCR